MLHEFTIFARPVTEATVGCRDVRGLLPNLLRPIFRFFVGFHLTTVLVKLVCFLNILKHVRVVCRYYFFLHVILSHLCQSIRNSWHTYEATVLQLAVWIQTLLKSGLWLISREIGPVGPSRSHGVSEKGNSVFIGFGEKHLAFTHQWRGRLVIAFHVIFLQANLSLHFKGFSCNLFDFSEGGHKSQRLGVHLSILERIWRIRIFAEDNLSVFVNCTVDCRIMMIELDHFVEVLHRHDFIFLS